MSIVAVFLFVILGAPGLTAVGAYVMTGSPLVVFFAAAHALIVGALVFSFTIGAMQAYVRRNS